MSLQFARAVATAAGYETTCSRPKVEAWLRLRLRIAWRELPRCAALPPALVPTGEQGIAIPLDVEASALLRCADGIEQCADCARRERARAWRAVLESVPAGPCAYCGAADAPTVDHVVPLVREGPHDPANLVRACRRCNASKNRLTPEEWAATGRAPEQWTIFVRFSDDVARRPTATGALTPEVASGGTDG